MTNRQQNLFLLATGFFWFALYTYPVLLGNHVRNTLGAAPTMAGLVVGSYGFTQMLLRIPVGYASDKLRRRTPFLLAGACSALLAALGLFAAQNAVAALLARGLAGVAASTWVCYTILYGTAQAPERRVQAMGTLSACMYAAQLTATLLGGALARGAGVRASFLLGAGAGLIGTLLCLGVQDRPPKAAALAFSDVGRVLRGPMLLYCALLSIFMQMALWATLYGFSPGWAEQFLHADPAQLGLLSTVHLIPTIIVSKIAASCLVPRLGEKRTLALGFACLAIGCFFMQYTRTFWQMLCLQALCGFGVGCSAPLLLALCTRGVAPERQGVAMGAYQSLYGIGMFLGPLLAGFLAERASLGSAAPGGLATSGVALQASGYRAVFVAAACLALASGALSFWTPSVK